VGHKQTILTSSPDSPSGTQADYTHFISWFPKWISSRLYSLHLLIPQVDINQTKLTSSPDSPRGYQADYTGTHFISWFPKWVSRQTILTSSPDSPSGYQADYRGAHFISWFPKWVSSRLYSLHLLIPQVDIKQTILTSSVPWRCVPERSVPVTIRPLDFCNDPSPRFL
jgi:hypothetical protein